MSQVFIQVQLRARDDMKVISNSGQITLFDFMSNLQITMRPEIARDLGKRMIAKADELEGVAACQPDEQ